MDLRALNFQFNHAPANPRLCNNPYGICSACQTRIDEEDALRAETCPACKSKSTYVTHASKGLRTCNGCQDRFCTECLYGARYCCAYVYGVLPAPPRISRPLPLPDLPSPTSVREARAPEGGTSLASH